MPQKKFLQHRLVLTGTIPVFSDGTHHLTTIVSQLNHFPTPPLYTPPFSRNIPLYPFIPGVFPPHPVYSVITEYERDLKQIALLELEKSKIRGESLSRDLEAQRVGPSAALAYHSEVRTYIA